MKRLFFSVTLFCSVYAKGTITISKNISGTEGTTVQLLCEEDKKTYDIKTSYTWYNGNDTIKNDTRVTQSNEPPISYLTIEKVTRWDSGDYSCIIVSNSKPKIIKYTLKVLYPPENLSLEVVGAKESTTVGGKVKKFIVKQGEPFQFICNVDGNPKPNVQWIKREKDQQMLLNAQSQVLDQSKAPPQQLPTLIVSYTSEFKIESANAQHDAGHYECIAQNKLSVDSPTNMELELVIEYPPSITVSQPLIHTGETYTARIVCTVDAFPVANVTWEKEQTNLNGSSSYVQLYTNDSSRYQTLSSKDLLDQVSVPQRSEYGLNMTLQSSEDFGNYRCKAENRLGHAYSDNITLTDNNFNESNKTNENDVDEATNISNIKEVYALFIIIILVIIVAVLGYIRFSIKSKYLKKKMSPNANIQCNDIRSLDRNLSVDDKAYLLPNEFPMSYNLENQGDFELISTVHM